MRRRQVWLVACEYFYVKETSIAYILDDWRALDSLRRLQKESWNDERMNSFRDAAQ